MTRAQQLTEPAAYHGEGPVWTGELQWVDMLAGDVLTLSADGQVSRRHVAPLVAALRPRVDGGFVYAVERGFALDDGPGTSVRILPELWSTTGVRMNEGGCDPHGRFYCGSMAYDQTPNVASLYRLDPDGSVTVVLSGSTISNGLEWNPDGTRAYYVDTSTGGVDVFDYDQRAGLTGRRRFADVSGGAPDGLTVDAEGGVWVAVWGGSAVHRYAPDGSLSDVVSVPVHQVSACTFGGPELATLFITTSRQGLASDEEPAAGALFDFQPGVSGRPVKRYDG